MGGSSIPGNSRVSILSEKSFSLTDQQKSKMQHATAKEEDRNEVPQSYAKHQGDDSRGSNIDSSQGTPNLAVKTEEREDLIARRGSFWLREGSAGAGPRIHTTYRETKSEDSSS